jgi:hypothetical protein
VVSIDEPDERRERLSVESRRVSGEGASSSSLWVEIGCVSISIYITIRCNQIDIVKLKNSDGLQQRTILSAPKKNEKKKKLLVERRTLESITKRKQMTGKNSKE